MVPLIAYALLGPSRILVLGPDSAVAPLVAAAVIPIAAGDMQARVEIAGLLAIMVGIICFAGGVAGVGFLTDLISRPVRLGYMAGIALTIIVSQIPAMLGIDAPGEGVVDKLQATIDRLSEFNGATAAIGVTSLVALLAMKHFWPRLPSALLVVVGAIVVQRFAQLDVDTVGSLPTGLPSLDIPTVASDQWGRLALSSVAIALIAFADTSILSRAYAQRLGDDVDSNQELRALGGANLATGLFQGFPISSSSSRTPAAEQAGAKSQLTGLVAAVGLGIVLLFAGDIFRNLPAATLSALLINSAIALIDAPEFKRLWSTYRPDCYLALAALVGVTIAGVLWGIGVAIVLSILAFLWNAWHPHVAVLGRAPGVKGYHDVTRYPDAKRIPGLLIFRFDAPIFFANAELFRDSVLRAVQTSQEPVALVVIAAEPITDLDSTAADVLAALERELDAKGIELAFAELRDPMKDRLMAFGLVEQVGSERFYPTLGMAVRDYVERYEVDWIDWEDVSVG
jgi:high affinity sulfate transporter 1